MAALFNPTKEIGSGENSTAGHQRVSSGNLRVPLINIARHRNRTQLIQGLNRNPQSSLRSLDHFQPTDDSDQEKDSIQRHLNIDQTTYGCFKKNNDNDHRAGMQRLSGTIVAGTFGEATRRNQYEQMSMRLSVHRMDVPRREFSFGSMAATPYSICMDLLRSTTEATVARFRQEQLSVSRPYSTHRLIT